MILSQELHKYGLTFLREVYDHFFPHLRSCTNYKHLSALRKGKIIC